jgi:predicted NBD/HSP70 family sugar kinase
MRKINTNDFRVATRTTSREINQRIALNLVREHQPISRADLARKMNVTRSVVSVLIAELMAEGLIREGVTGEARRGRKPTFLHLSTQDRLVVAVDIRLSRTYLMLSDFEGQQISLEKYSTILSPAALVKDLAKRITRLLKTHGAVAHCKGIGVAVPGIVDQRTGRILNAPTLGWRDVELLSGLASQTGLPVHIENAARACALAQMWLGGRGGDAPHSFVHVSVSDGVGVGVVVNGELVRGHDNMAGEFGHVPLNIEGPPCMCGANGCWEAYISNIATLSRYFGRDLSKIPPKSLLAGARPEGFSISDLITRARGRDGKAIDAVQATARYLGLGLAMLVNGLNPECVYIGGEITTAWDLVAPTLRKALAERVLTEAAAQTPILIAEPSEHPRLRGAAALVATPLFAAPRVA